MRSGPVWIITTCGLAVVGFFLPWGIAAHLWRNIRLGPGTPNGEVITGFALRAGLLKEDRGDYLHVPLAPIQSWSNVAGVDFPDWLILAAILFVGVFGVLATMSSARVPAWLASCFSLYGTLHLLVVWARVVPHGKVGAGLVLTTLAFGTLTVLTLRAVRLQGRLARLPVKPAAEVGRGEP